MHVKDFAKAMKNLPARFSNLTFWRECRKLKDSVVDALEYLNDWGIGIENALNNKLPKSPSDWEAWTVEEQAEARARIAADGEWQCITLNADDYDAENHRFMIDVGEVRKITEVYGIGQVVTNTEAPADLSVGIGFGNANNYSYGTFGQYSIPKTNTQTSFSFEGKSVDFTNVKNNVYSQFGTVRYAYSTYDKPDFYIDSNIANSAYVKSFLYWNYNDPRYFSIFGLWDNVTWAAIKIYIKLR